MSFSIKAFNNWLKTEIETELKKIPLEIREKAKTEKNLSYILLSSVCSKLCFNQNSLDVQNAFKEALNA
jgi:hypothetical protein